MATGASAASPAMAAVQAELSKLRKSSLSTVIKGVDEAIDLLTRARDQVAAEPQTAHLTMVKLQNPVQERFEKARSGLQSVYKAQKKFEKALDKALPLRPLPTETDAMAEYPALINRAIVMHLLREGEFSVASTFIREAQDYPPDLSSPTWDSTTGRTNPAHLMHRESEPLPRGNELLERFSEMYRILGAIKARNLGPAIEWSATNGDLLDLLGSPLEFDLAKLQFIWLFKGGGQAGSPDAVDQAGRMAALSYAQNHFGKFLVKHTKDVQQLTCALVYASNIAQSPYHHLLDTARAIDDITAAFTHDFCAILGLSAESPLYLATTAGAIALPQLLKFATMMSAQKTEWTQENELPMEMPLPNSMRYHPIFVCPVLRVETTDQNPPMMLPCGHVICREALQNLSKTSTFKCPYCPCEGMTKDAVRVRF